MVDKELLTDRLNIEEEADKKISKLSSEIATLISVGDIKCALVSPGFLTSE